MAEDQWYRRLLDFLVGGTDTGTPDINVNGSSYDTSSVRGGTVIGPGSAALVPFRGGLTAGRSGAQAARILPSRAPSRYPGRVDVLGTTRNTRQALPRGASGGTRTTRNVRSGPKDASGARGVSLLNGTSTADRARRAAFGVGATAAGGVAVDNLINGKPVHPNARQPGNLNAQRRAKREAEAQELAPDIFRPVTSVNPQGGGNFQGANQDDFMQGYLDDFAASYDAQIAAIGGLAPIYREQGAEAQENVGKFFGHAGDVAREGIPVTEQIYDDAGTDINAIYDNLAGNLQSLPGQLTGIAEAAGGSAVDGSVAGRVASAAAPFMAAGETSRANASANLTQHSSAGQNYLNQLASATGAESAMSQSAIESALNQQLQLVAARQAELEGAKQRGLMEISADIAGSSAEQMGNQALAHALGLDLPAGVDPLDFLRGQGMMQGDAVDPIDQARDMIGLEQAQLNLLQDQNPNWETDQVLGGISFPARNAYEDLLTGVESQFDPDIDDRGDIVYKLLENLDAMIAEGELDNSFSQSGLNNQSTDEIAEEIRNAIRRIHG